MENKEGQGQSWQWHGALQANFTSSLQVAERSDGTRTPKSPLVLLNVLFADCLLGHILSLSQFFRLSAPHSMLEFQVRPGPRPHAGIHGVDHHLPYLVNTYKYGSHGPVCFSSLIRLKRTNTTSCVLRYALIHSLLSPTLRWNTLINCFIMP